MSAGRCAMSDTTTSATVELGQAGQDALGANPAPPPAVAIQWGIAQYDAAKAEPAAVPA